MLQATENRARGRRQLASDQELLRYEGHWVETLLGLRDGVPGTEVKTTGGSGAFIKSRQQGRETLQVIVPGKATRTVRQPKFTTTPDEMENWRGRARELHENFTHEMLTTEGKTAISIPAERHLWEALKHAKSAAQVRRICSLSKVWLTSRLEFPEGGYVEYWTYRRALYKYAAEFCEAKLDSRYPRLDKRASGDYRRIEYLARVLAGLSSGTAPSTTVERLRKMKHTPQCPCWRCRSKIRPRYSRTLAQLLCGRVP